MKFRIGLLLYLIFGIAAAEDRVMEVIHLQNRPAVELRTLINPLLENAEDIIIVDGSDLILKTTPERLQSIKSLIKQLDVQPVNLIVTVVQNTHLTAAELNAGSSAKSADIRMHGMNADTRDVSGNQIFQSLRTLDGRPAYIMTGYAKPVQNINLYAGMNAGSQKQGAVMATANGGNGYPIVGLDNRMQETGSGFTVVPRLSGSQVILDITPWSSNYQQGNSVETHGVHVTLRANLGEWQDIAGDGNSKGNQRKNGFNTFNHGTLDNNDRRVFVKVEKGD